MCSLGGGEGGEQGDGGMWSDVTGDIEPDEGIGQGEGTVLVSNQDRLSMTIPPVTIKDRAASVRTLPAAVKVQDLVLTISLRVDASVACPLGPSSTV